MSKQYNIAVVGATGAVGEVMLDILHQRKFPAGKVHALASSRSEGKLVAFGNRELVVENLENFDFSTVDIALFSAGGSVSAEYVPKAAAAGCVCIDNTSHFRYEDDIPLVISEVNPQAIAGYRNRNIIANPNCSTMQMLVALAPIHRGYTIERINVATYQAVSGSGQSAMEELARQTADKLNFRDVEAKVYPQPIAFNVLPEIDVYLDNGYTKEEMKMYWETQKILGDDSIQVNATAVRVPVFYGHAEAVHIETKEETDPDTIRELLRNAAGVEVVDERRRGGFASPAVHAAGKDPVYVSRIRKDISHPRGLNLWVVADNVRKGAALNSVQIAELLVKDHLK